MWLGIQDVWVWDAERNELPVDGGIRKMAGVAMWNMGWL